MKLKWDFWNQENKLDYDDVRREFGQIEALDESAGWEWMKGMLEARRGSLLKLWSRGGHDLSMHERLAAQVELIGEILELPQERASELSGQMQEAKADIRNVSDPIDQDQMSPVPDENPDYLG